MSPELQKMTDDVLNLATVMRPFLMGKPGQITMSTLCMLAAEIMVNNADPEKIDKNVKLMAKCVIDYVELLQKDYDAPKTNL